MLFNFLTAAADAKGIAVVHSLFNIGCTVVLLPFANVLEKIALLTIKDSKEDLEKAVEKFNSRDRRFGGVKEGEK